MEEGFKKTVIKTCRQFGEDYWENTASYLLNSLSQENRRESYEDTVISCLLQRLFLRVLQAMTNHYPARKLISLLSNDPNFYELPAQLMKLCLQDVIFFAESMITNYQTSIAIVQHSQQQVETQMYLK